MNFFSSVLGPIFDILLPPRGSDRAVRDLSLDTLQSIALPDGALPYHDGRVKALVWELKYHGSTVACTLAGEYMAEMLTAVASEEIGKPLLIPVPMHKKRRRERGHNQTEVLCEAALQYIDDAFEYEPTILLRTRNTPSQQGLERHKRLHNVEHSMEVADPTRIAGRVCVVVDDVSTTGATLKEARRALLEAGARKVVCVALAQS